MGGGERKEAGEIRQFGGREVTICSCFVVLSSRSGHLWVGSGGGGGGGGKEPGEGNNNMSFHQ